MENNSLAILRSFGRNNGQRIGVGLARRANEGRAEGGNFWKIEIFQVEASQIERFWEDVGRPRNTVEYLARVYAPRRWRHNRFTYSAEKGGTVVLR